MNTKKKYYLLLIDIVNSTQMPNKNFALKMKLIEKQLKVLNKTFSSKLVLPLDISYGDEIAGLFKKPEPIYTVVSEIRKIFYPLTNIRFVVVKGTIGRVSKDIRQIGGVVFKKANEAITTLKNNNHFCSWLLDDSIINKTLESLCHLTNTALEDMSNYQRSVYYLYQKNISQTKIASQLKKQKQSVWDTIQRSHANYILNAESTIHLILKHYE